MKYVLPAVSAVARGAETDRSFLTGMRPVIVGPRAGLHRYAVAAEQASLGAYNKLSQTTYAYPHKATGSVVDLASVKIYADSANLLYFSKPVGINGSCQRSATYPNRVRAASFVFKTSAAADRSSAFYDRDVKIGDTVRVRGTGLDAAVYDLTTVVTGFVGEPIAAVTGAATADANNAGSQSQSASVSQVLNTPINDVVATVHGSAYLSTADGYVTRTYTVTVTTSSTGTDATTARVRVRSADGLDDQDDVVPSAFGSPTAIGTKGLTLTWSIDPAHSSGSDVDQDDLVVGQAWTVTASQAFTPPVATSGGTYAGATSTTYIVNVSRGGRYVDATQPQITVTSTNGYDRSGPTTVTAAATTVAVGNYNLTVSFAGTYLRKNDVYYITAAAAGQGALQTLVLRDSVSDQLVGQEVDLYLSVVRSGYTIPSARTFPSATTNWTASGTSVVVASGIEVLDPEFTDGADPLPVALDAAALYVEYREWLTAGGGSVVELTQLSQVEAALGSVTEDNPLAYAAALALDNTAGELVGDPKRPTAGTTDRIMCVALGGDPADLGLWTSALELVADNDEAYHLVPLSSVPAVHDLFAAHVTDRAADAVGMYRVCWLSRPLAETGAVVSAATSTDDQPVTTTIAATAGTSPTAYTTLTASSNAKFITLGVRAGDVVRTDFGTDAFGAATYTSYVVSAVLSETVLVLATGPTGAVTVGRQTEVWRTYTKAELVAQLTTAAAGYGSSLVRLVFPDQPAVGGSVVAGYHLCAALAGLAGSVPSNQGLKNVGLIGFDDLSRASKFFTGVKLDELAAGGVFVVSQSPSGDVYVRNAVTTDPSALATREEMIVRNADMIRKAIQDEWAPYVGAGNVLSNMTELLGGALKGLTARLRATSTASRLGAPVGDLTLTSLEAVSGSPDVINATITVVGLAVPLNQLRVLLPVSV